MFKRAVLLAMMLVICQSEPQGGSGSYLPPTTGQSPAAPSPPRGRPPQNEGHPDEWAGDPINYDFAYEVQHEENEPWHLDFGHHESRKDNEATGGYHVLLPDGRHLYVDYIANEQGFQPKIRYEGTATYGGPAHGAGASPAQPEDDGYKY